MMEIDDQPVDPLDHNQDAVRHTTEIPSNELEPPSNGNHELRQITTLKHNLPERMLKPKTYSFSKNHAQFGTKVGVPHSKPQSLLFPKPDCYVIDMKDGRPPSCVSFNSEGDEVICKLVDEAIAEYLSLEMNNFAFRDKYKWMNRWAMMRYNQPSSPNDLHLRDTQSLDDILDYNSDSSSSSCQPRVSVARSPTSQLNVAKETDRLTRQITGRCLPISDRERKELVVPVMNFYNSIPCDPGVSASTSKTSDECELISNKVARSSRIREIMMDNASSENNNAKDLSSIMNMNCKRKSPLKTVSWSRNLEAVKEFGHSGNSSCLQDKARKRRRYNESFDAYNQTPEASGNHCRHLTAYNYHNHRKIHKNNSSGGNYNHKCYHQHDEKPRTYRQDRPWLPSWSDLPVSVCTNSSEDSAYDESNSTDRCSNSDDDW